MDFDTKSKHINNSEEEREDRLTLTIDQGTEAQMASARVLDISPGPSSKVNLTPVVEAAGATPPLAKTKGSETKPKRA